MIWHYVEVHGLFNHSEYGHLDCFQDFGFIKEAVNNHGCVCFCIGGGIRSWLNSRSGIAGPNGKYVYT